MNVGDLVSGRGIYFGDYGVGVIIENTMGVLTVWWFDKLALSYASPREVQILKEASK